MTILFLTRLFLPHIGGVEKHVFEITKRFRRKGHRVKIISKEDINYPQVKYLGLLYIWFWLFKHRSLIEKSDIIHSHDVFVWYLPFRFFYPNKPVYTTFHGGQDIWPIPRKHIFFVKLAARLSWGTIAIGDFIEKYFGIKPNFVSYGGVRAQRLHRMGTKDKKQIIFLGRLEKATGVNEFIKKTRKFGEYKIDFVGDGSLGNKCSRYGKVHGFTNPEPFLQKATFCFAGGYLAALEALSYGCKLWVAWNTPLKKDYWLLSPFVKWIDTDSYKDAYKWTCTQTWENVSKLYLRLWKII